MMRRITDAAPTYEGPLSVCFRDDPIGGLVTGMGRLRSYETSPLCQSPV
jgi:hypothetical protein